METERRVLVINGKGGCGKTTIATNLAVTFSSMQHTVALMDNDLKEAVPIGQKLDPQVLPRKHNRLSPAAKHVPNPSFSQSVPSDTEIIVVDGHSNARQGP